MRFTLLVCFALLFPYPVWADEKPLPRVLVALYDSREESSPRTSQTHRFLEMPANHLGFDIQYYDITERLPVLGDDVAGIVVWFDGGVEVPDAKLYLDWLTQGLAHGKKLIIIENGGLGDKWRKDPEILRHWNEVLHYIGLADDNSWSNVTYPAFIEMQDKQMVGFEREIKPPLPPFGGTHVIGNATSHLRMHLPAGQESSFDLVVTSPRGGFINEGYAIFHIEKEDTDQSDVSQWFVNPFIFLKEALQLESAPIPDVTTLDGRRIFYSQIDGDGWNNISEIPKYQKDTILSSEVIYEEILKPYSDFVFNVGLITADVDPDCYGVRDSERVAREIFALSNVEPSSHTHSHPLFWQFFDHYSRDREKAMLNHYPPKPKERVSALTNAVANTTKDDWSAPAPTDKAPAAAIANDPPVKLGRNDEPVDTVLKKYAYMPRSYACKPFDLNDEVAGSIATINALAPAGKKVRLLQWSGDTSPFEKALAKVREAGAFNINGGDSRFDSEYPSYASVSPIGLKIGNERQIFSSNSNENTYTNLWTERFFGYRYLQSTVANTESPIRVQPFNLYFHIYSGQKQASLNAVKENMEFARKQDIIPITASDYADIANGFYAVKIARTGDNSWHISHHGLLQTIRFDDAQHIAVDMDASTHVMGQRYYQGSMYVALQPATEDSYMVLKNNDNNVNLPAAQKPYLIESNLFIKDLNCSKLMLTVEASGYGHGIMRWKMPKSGEYSVNIKKGNVTMAEKRITVSEDGILSLPVDDISAADLVTITIGL